MPKKLVRVLLLVVVLGVMIAPAFAQLSTPLSLDTATTAIAGAVADYPDYTVLTFAAAIAAVGAGFVLGFFRRAKRI